MGHGATIRHPKLEDGSAVWKIVKESGLAQNSPYIYLLMCDQFASTCAVAELDDQLQGIALGFYLPDKEKTLFLWQIGILGTARGRRLASRMLLWLMEKNKQDMKFLEATVTPSNTASRRLFHSVARTIGAEITEEPYLTPDLYPTPEAETDLLLHIGPLT